MRRQATAKVPTREPQQGSPSGLPAVLDAEAELFGDLAQLAAEQRRALLKADSERLEQLADRAHTLATRFRLLDRERLRLEQDVEPGDENDALARARSRVAVALQTLLEQAALSGTVLGRLGDTVATRQAAVSALFGSAYLPDGRPVTPRASGVSLSREG
ncbi:MAG: flagellar export chaperone FlgN [Acidobacteriota bacterium]|nr:MAG: flagellar export chaperone FlgN [Acidobacteriota bacterium]